MKKEFRSLQYIIVTILCIVAFNFTTLCQEIVETPKIKPGLFVELNVGTSQTAIVNDGTNSISEIKSGKGNSLFVNAEVGYFFSKYIGISSGIGLHAYKSQLTLDTYQNKFNTTDSENEHYEKQISAINIVELQNLTYLSVPMLVNFNLPIGNKFGLLLQTGLGINFPLKGAYESSGVFTYKGYYPAYNVTLEDLPDYGFPSNLGTKGNGKLELTSPGFNAVASFGVDYKVNGNIQIGLKASYSSSLSNIATYSSPENFQLSSNPDELNSVMGGCSKVSAQSLGLEIMVRYLLYGKN